MVLSGSIILIYFYTRGYIYIYILPVDNAVLNNILLHSCVVFALHIIIGSHLNLSSFYFYDDFFFIKKRAT